MSNCLIIVETSADAEPMCAFGSLLGVPFDLLVLCGDGGSAFGQAKTFVCGLTEAPPADALCSALATIASQYSIVATAATMFGKDFLPRLAGLLDRPMISDVTKAFGDNRFERPMYAGNVNAIVRPTVDKYLVSVRTSSFSSAAANGVAATEQISLTLTGSTERTHTGAKKAGRPDLTQAKVVVSGGRPLKDAETFERVIGGLADAMGGAVGATRAAVDAGIAPNEMQVGQTGKIVAPELYVAAGISGSTQHIAGMKESKTIVAINTDPDAPIFELADYGLVQDLFVALPEIQSKLKR
ncbi:MAG: FAD-binding protein [Fimbriimonadales bacterium]